MSENNERPTVRLYHSGAKVFLDYEVSILREVLNLVRDGSDAFAATSLRDYEHRLIETVRLEENRSREEFKDKIVDYEERKVNADIE